MKWFKKKEKKVIIPKDSVITYWDEEKTVYKTVTSYSKHNTMEHKWFYNDKGVETVCIIKDFERGTTRSFEIEYVTKDIWFNHYEDTPSVLWRRNPITGVVKGYNIGWGQEGY